jgi:hypothetical protein
VSTDHSSGALAQEYQPARLLYPHNSQHALAWKVLLRMRQRQYDQQGDIAAPPGSGSHYVLADGGAAQGNSHRAHRNRSRSPELTTSEMVLGGAMFLVWFCLVLWANAVSVSEDAAAECMSRTYRDPVTGRTMPVGNVHLDAQSRPVCNHKNDV